MKLSMLLLSTLVCLNSICVNLAQASETTGKQKRLPNSDQANLICGEPDATSIAETIYVYRHNTEGLFGRVEGIALDSANMGKPNASRWYVAIGNDRYVFDMRSVDDYNCALVPHTFKILLKNEDAH